MAKSKSKSKSKNNDLSMALRKHVFWIILGLIGVSGSIVWLMATMKLADRTEANIRTIQGYDSLRKSVLASNPNKNFITEIEEKTGQRVTDNHNNWRKVFNEQQQVLTWPESFTQSFLTAVNRLPLPERLTSDDSLTSNFRSQYQNFAKNQVDDLCKIINAPNLLGSNTGTNKGLPAGYLVEWDAKSQKTVENVLRFRSGSVPSTRQVLYAQEDYWVYSTLAKIVANTNKNAGAEGSYNAAVKRIEAFGTGVDFVPDENTSLYLLKGGDDDLDPDQIPKDPNDDVDIEIPAKLLIAGNRYVDARGQALKGSALLALEDPVTEFKRMPVYMRLVIDHRHLGSLMAECNNSPLTVEVRKVIYQSEKSAAASRRTASGYYELTVEIYGTVYIFYPPPSTSSADGDEAAVPAA